MPTAKALLRIKVLVLTELLVLLRVGNWTIAVGLRYGHTMQRVYQQDTSKNPTHSLAMRRVESSGKTKRIYQR